MGQPPTNKALYEAAVAAAARAYSPYSGVTVGAAIETASGAIFLGANVESASFGLTICAERSALAAAVSAGERHFRRVAVALQAPGGVHAEPVPCGACLQFLAEFCDDDTPVITSPRGRRRLKDFLPQPFRMST